MAGLKLRINSPDLGYLNARAQPDINGALVTQVAHASIVTALDADATVRARVGQQGQWLYVNIDGKQQAYVAAWYVELLEEPSHPGVAVGAPSPTGMQVWVYSPEVGYLNIRSAPSTRGTLIDQVQHNTSVQALDAEAEVRARLGQHGQWLNVRLPDGRVGYAAASYLSPVGPPAPDASLEPSEEEKINVTPGLSGVNRQVAQTWNRLGGQLQMLAEQLGIDPGVGVAVWAVESAGRPFGPDGRMTIRFENHIFYNLSLIHISEPTRPY